MADLDPSVLETLNRILAKDLSEVTPDDVSFLKARVSYLTGDQVKKFEDILDMKPDKVVEPEKVMSGKKK